MSLPAYLNAISAQVRRVIGGAVQHPQVLVAPVVRLTELLLKSSFRSDAQTSSALPCSGKAAYTSQQSSSSTSIELKEADNFKKFADHWWDTSGELGPLHSMNHLRVPFIRNGLRSLHPELSDSSEGDYVPLKGFRILDIGCGGGILDEPLAALGAQVLGIDEVAESVEVAGKHADLTAHRWSSSEVSKPQYRLTSLRNIASEMPGHFDAVIASEVLEHIQNWEEFLSEAALCLKPGGMLFITTLNRTPASLLLGIVAAEYITHLVPRGSHEWKKFIEPSRLQTVLLRNGLRPQQLVGLHYNPLTGRWSWTANLSINYALSAVKLVDKPRV